MDLGLEQVTEGIGRAKDRLLSLQHPDGYWCGELEADSMLEADYIYLHTLLESGDPGRMKRALTEILRYQKEDGSWSLYPEGPGNISLAVKCYFACKLMGMSANCMEAPPCSSRISCDAGTTSSLRKRPRASSCTPARPG